MIDANWVIGGIVEGAENEILQIVNLTWGRQGIEGWIENIGLHPAYNVSWSTNVQGGFLGWINVSNHGLVKVLPVGESTPFCTGRFWGFGKLGLTIAVSADNVPKMTLTKNWFQIGFFILNLK
jgi:hypothetical protein